LVIKKKKEEKFQDCQVRQYKVNHKTRQIRKVCFKIKWQKMLFELISLKSIKETVVIIYLFISDYKKKIQKKHRKSILSW